MNTSFDPTGQCVGKGMECRTSKADKILIWLSDMAVGYGCPKRVQVESGTKGDGAIQVVGKEGIHSCGIHLCGIH